MQDTHEQELANDDFELDRPTSRLIIIYHALSHPVRLTICKNLLIRPHTVSELNEILNIKQYVVSQQLAVLRNADVVETERQSRNIIYSLRSEAVRRILRVSMRNVTTRDDQDVLVSTPRASGFAKINS